MPFRFEELRVFHQTAALEVYREHYSAYERLCKMITKFGDSM